MDGIAMTADTSRSLALGLVDNWFNPAWLEENCHDDFQIIYQADPLTFAPAAAPPVVKSGLQAYQAAAMAGWRELPTVRAYGLVVAEEDRAALQVSVSGTARTGVELVVRNAFFVEIREGRILRLHMHVDTLAPTRAKITEQVAGFFEENSSTFFERASSPVEP
jgi:ketosteroid isomerase-like protein